MPDTGGNVALPYPDLSDVSNVPQYIQALAERTAAVFSYDSGIVTIATVSGFDASGASYRKIGPVVTPVAAVTYTGGGLSNVNGFLTALPAAAKPAQTIPCMWLVNNAFGCRGAIDATTGQLQFKGLTIATNDILFLVCGSFVVAF
jgi:hypothetical protein